MMKQYKKITFLALDQISILHSLNEYLIKFLKLIDVIHKFFYATYLENDGYRFVKNNQSTISKINRGRVNLSRVLN